MTETDTTAPINKGDFALKLDGPLQITLPPMPVMTEEDVDAQLFSFIANAPKGSNLHCLADLDDAWAQEAYPGISGIKEYREMIKKGGDQEYKHAYQNLKVACISDALLSHLEGAVSGEVVDAHLDEVRERMEENIHASGSSIPQYLRENNLTEKEFLEKIREETEHDIALGIALDLYVEQNGISVGDEEIVRYLMTDDPEEFMQELRKTGQLEAARAAAARIKSMRQIMDSTKITIEENA